MYHHGVVKNPCTQHLPYLLGRPGGAFLPLRHPEIPAGGEERTFPIPEAETYFNGLYCAKVKADSQKKQDITLQLQDIHTGISPICGFSIKSYLGGAPTLINAGKNTNFVFSLCGCTDQIMDEANNIRTKQKNKDRIKYLINSGCEFVPIKHSISEQFEENLQFVDTAMPELLQLLVLYSYKYAITPLSNVVDLIKKDNPLGYRNKETYKYKVKKLLCACALGMTPGKKNWEGTEDANGGYITVKRDGTVVCYHVYNRTDFENYLYDYTRFERADTSKMKYLKVYKENDEYRIKLNLQVRFK